MDCKIKNAINFVKRDYNVKINFTGNSTKILSDDTVASITSVGGYRKSLVYHGRLFAEGEIARDPANI